ncbi:MAG: Na(+)/H(+) antiporter subunit E1 [Planctomycetes bacterium ADurb.Bin126]|nr:MAG: Na(+)/H(+) antiporter subunit E1 [Planctomycetes bacterium ADurb.Bin126]HOD83576.1 Na+/H+ antiporter subunit E [Phycisphaerae bacterium]HQL74675.1 Na+/H+ antiporter subunit E [Phycisphaerae bacterium]
MKWLMCLLLVFALWMLLFWEFSLSVLASGLFFALIVSTLLGDIFPDNLHSLFNPRRWFFLLLYLPYFLFYCVKANLDVALRVLHPDVPIHPGIVKVTTTLKTPLAKTALANSITLTPGTLTVDIDGQDLYVHWINVSGRDLETRSKLICGVFEPMLRRIFE